MVNRYGDPRVKEWMKEHKEEVEKVQKRYDELKEANIESLVRMAHELGVDLTKVRERLIAGIIAEGGVGSE